MRELDKKRNKAEVSKTLSQSDIDDTSNPEQVNHNILPWVLLVVSWVVIAAYFVIAM